MGRLQDQITLDSFAALAATANGAVFNLSGYTAGSIYCVCSAVGTTPTLSATLQTTIDGTNWIQVPTGVIPVITGPTSIGTTIGSFLVPFGLGKCRFAYTVGGGAPLYTGQMVGILNHP
jgi:hypothetical protein